jgi:hypothetical protein
MFPPFSFFTSFPFIIVSFTPCPHSFTWRQCLANFSFSWTRNMYQSLLYCSVDQPSKWLKDQVRLPLDSNVFARTLAHRLFSSTFIPCLWISHPSTQWLSWKKRSVSFPNDSPHLV